MAKVTITLEDKDGGVSITADFGPGFDAQKELSNAQTGALEIMQMIGEVADEVKVDGDIVKHDTKGMH